MRRRELSDVNRFPESLEARLRSLTPPPVPGELEARILAAIPEVTLHVRKLPLRRRPLRAGALIASVAACFLIVFVLRSLQHPNGGVLDPGLVGTPDGNPAEQVQTGKFLDIVARLEDRRGLNELEPPKFSWPIHEWSALMCSKAIPRDLLE